MTEQLRAITVVVPARDEQDTICGTLTSIRRAASRLHEGRPHVEVTTVLVVNGSTDRTAELARAEDDVHVVLLPDPCVGTARAAGARWAVRRHHGAPEKLWLASTDADGTVPADWLIAHADCADDGADLVLGTVRLTRPEALHHADWTRRYDEAATASTTHGHVHGANLGVRASAYLAVGGYAPLRVHEDVDLARRLIAADVPAAWLTHVPVTTSARHDARVVGGVGTDLATSS